MSTDQPRPLVVSRQPGRHAICQCGQTGNAPFCDGTHKTVTADDGSTFSPTIEVVEGQPKNVAWCRCFTTGNTPWCDGSHTALWTGSGPDEGDA